MASVNKVILVGNLGADPEARYLPNGDAVSNLRIATTDTWKDKDGNKQEAVEWHRVSAFGKLAEICNQYLKKGSQVFIEGAIRTRKWQDKDGQDRYTTEIKAHEMKMLGSRPQQGGQSEQPEPRQQQRGSPAPSAPGSFNDFEDDIPFVFNLSSVSDTMGRPTALWRARHGKKMLLLRANEIDC